MKRFPASNQSKLVISVCCMFLCLVIALVWFMAEPKLPPFLILQQPFSRPVPLRDQLVRWIPTASAWLPPVEDALLGRRTPVNVFAHIVTLPMTRDGDLPCVATLGRPEFLMTNGLAVWLLTGANLGALSNDLKATAGIDFLSHPRVSTADGVEASLFIGQSVLVRGSPSDVGLRAAFFPRAHKDLTDLIAMISFSELITNQTGVLSGGETARLSIRTNLDIAARLQVPKGSGLFLLNENTAAVGYKRFGVLIEPP